MSSDYFHFSSMFLFTYHRLQKSKHCCNSLRRPIQAFLGGKGGLLRRMTPHSQKFVISEIFFRSKTYFYFVQCPMEIYKRPLGGDEEEDNK